MVPFFKNSAFRIWCAGLLSFLFSLWLLPHTGEAISLTKSLLIFGAVFSGVFVGIGWLTDHLVRIQLDPLLQEAGILERGGMGLEAERTFERALALLDSFLVSPLRRRRYLRALGKRMARFYAAQAEKSDQAFKWITRYLNADPGDGAIAEVWLQDMERLVGWTKPQQDLAARIGAAGKDDPHLQTTLARIYIRADRTDFPALQTYRRVMTARDHALGPMILDLSRLFIKEGRADEWALRAYVHAAHRGEPSKDLLCGLAACLRWTQDTERTRDLGAQARQIIGPIGENEIERMSSGFLPPTGRFEPTVDVARTRTMLQSGLRWTVRLIGDVDSGLRQGIKKAAAGLKSPRLRFPLKVGLISALALVAIAMIVNTTGHLVKPPAPPPAPPPEVAVKIEPTPYTLQVAAYLKPEHAERFIKLLQDRGQNAFRVETQSQQKIWYQVRVGHFPTKAAARAHGQQLKTGGIIDDFYVANHQRP